MTSSPVVEYVRAAEEKGSSKSGELGLIEGFGAGSVLSPRGSLFENG